MGRGGGRSHGRSSHGRSSHARTSHAKTTHTTHARRTGVTHTRTHKSSFGRRRRVHHSSSSGTGGTGTTAGGEVVYVSSCYKEDYKKGLIAVGIILFLLIVGFVVVLTVVPQYKGRVCNGIKYVSIAETPVCRPSSGYVYFKGKGVTAYVYKDYAQYLNGYNSFPFNLKETIKGYGYSVFNVTECVSGYSYELKWQYSASDTVDIALMDDTQYSNFVKEAHGIIPGFVVDRGVTNCDREYIGSYAYHLVVYNPHDHSVTVKEEGSYAGRISLPNPDRAQKIYDGSGNFYVSKGNTIVLKYSRTDRTAEVVLLENYRFNNELIPAYVVFPMFLFMCICIFFGLFCCRASALTKAEAQKMSQETEMNNTTGNPNPDGVPPETAGNPSETTPEGSNTTPEGSNAAPNPNAPYPGSYAGNETSGVSPPGYGTDPNSFNTAQAPYPGANAPYPGGYPGGNAAPYPGENAAPYPGGYPGGYPGDMNYYGVPTTDTTNI